MKSLFLSLIILISFNSISQTVILRDTIRVGDSAVIVTTTKVVNTKTGSVSYTYKDTTTTVSKVKIFIGSNPTPNKIPVANAGNDLAIQLPINSVNLSGTGTDQDGNIVGYLWEKVSGGTAIIASPTTSTTSVNNLLAGTYVFKLTVTDNDGASGVDNLTVTVNQQSQPVDTTVSKDIQGYGKNNGGNGKPVVTVTSGSALLNAIKSNTYIKLDNKVSGSEWTFRGEFSNLVNVTIDGSESTFPVVLNNNQNGRGLAFEGSGCHDIIVRSIKIRNAGDDCAAANDGAYSIAFINCSFSGGSDGSIDITNSRDITIQYCIIGNSTNGGSLIDYPGTRNVSIHHNLYNSFERNALIGSQQNSSKKDLVCDFVNNIVWKWSNYGTDVNFNANANIRNNYYYSTSRPENAVLTKNNSYGPYPGGNAYVNGNFSGNGTNLDQQNNHAIFPVPAAAQVTMQDACKAARLVLANVGPVKKDASDINLIKSVNLPGCPAQ